MKPQLRHLGHTCGKCYERPYHRQQTAQKHSDAAILLKKSGDSVEVVVTHQNPAAVAQNQRTSANSADPVRDHRAQVAADRSGSCCPRKG